MTYLGQRLRTAFKTGDWDMLTSLSRGKSFCIVCGRRIALGSRHCGTHKFKGVIRKIASAAAAIVILGGCAPKVMQHQAAASRPRRPPLAALAPRTNITIAWDYVDNPRYSFNVYGGTNPSISTFRLLTNISTHYFVIPTDKPHMFFTVTCLDNYSGRESDWATK